MLTCNVKFMTIWFRETKYFLSLFLKTLVTLETPLGILLWHIIMAICVFSFIHLSPEASVILGDINKTELKMYCGPLNFGIHSCATEITRESVFSHVDRSLWAPSAGRLLFCWPQTAAPPSSSAGSLTTSAAQHHIHYI